MAIRINRFMAMIVAAGLLDDPARAAGSIAKSCGPDESYTIGLSQANFRDPRQAAMNSDFERLIRRYPQFKIIIADGQGSLDTQISQIENFLTQQVDMLFISASDAASLTPEVGLFMKAGIPVIEIGHRTLDDNYTSFVTGDDRAVARQAGDYVAATLMPDGGEIAILEGLAGPVRAMERRRSFRAGIAANPRIRIVAVQPLDWTQDKSVATFGAILRSHRNLRLVYACNDLAAAGAYAAVKQAGRLGQVRIIGIDGLAGSSSGIHAMTGRKWTAAKAYPTCAAEALRLAEEILIDCAPSVPKLVTVQPRLVDDSSARPSYATEGSSGNGSGSPMGSPP